MIALLGATDRIGEEDLRGALERDDQQMPPPIEGADREMERNAGLTADESLRRGAWGASWPPEAGLEAGRSVSWTESVVELVGSRAAETRVWSVAVVPGDVEPRLAAHSARRLSLRAG